MFLKHEEIDEPLRDPKTGDMVLKNVFLIFYQGERIQTKIKKICESFGANIYPCQETETERREFLSQVGSRLDDLEMVSLLSFPSDSKGHLPFQEASPLSVAQIE